MNDSSAAPSSGAPARADSILGNSIANTILGLATAIYSLSVPAMLVRVFPPNEFAVWALALQISGYASVLGLGLQDAIGRYVAFYAAKSDAAARNEFVSTAFYVLCVSAALAMIGFAATSASISFLFPQIPSNLKSASRVALLGVGAIAALGLPFSVFSGVLVGLRRYDLVSLILSTTKMLLAAVLILTAWRSKSLLWLTFWFAVLSLASYIVIWQMCTNRTSINAASLPFSRSAFGEIARYCGIAVVSQAAMFVISGLDVAIVGRFDFPSLAFYSVCVTPVIVLAGSTAALLGPLIQVGAAHAAHGRRKELAQLLVNGTRYAAIVMTFVAMVIVFFAEEILKGWLGSDYSSRSAPTLRLLMIGHAMRQLTYPYAALLVATGQQGKILLSPIVEATVNVLVAVLAGRQYGAVGVACAVVAGSVVMLIVNFSWNLRRTHGAGFDRKGFLLNSILLPVACFSPMSLLGVAGPLHLSADLSTYLRALLLIVSLALVWKFAIRSSEKVLGLEYFRMGWKQARRIIS